MRRAEIIEAAVALLAEQPLDRVSTRQVARRVGLSQPAIFRHFRSVEAIAEAVIDDLHQRLGAAVAPVFERVGAPAQLQALVQTLQAVSAARPALPRLLFGTVRGGPPKVQTALQRVLHQQRTVIEQIISGGQRAGTISRAAPAATLARDFLALIQGHLLQQLVWPEAAPAEGWVERWLVGAAGDGVAQPEPERTALGIAALDVRPILAGGADPLEQILAALAPLSAGAVLVIRAPFLPKPLIRLLEGRGHTIAVYRADDAPVFDVVVGVEAPLVELGDRAAPEPMEAALEATAGLAAGASWRAHVPRAPQLLLPHLAARGLDAQVHSLCDGSAVLWVGAP